MVSGGATNRTMDLFQRTVLTEIRKQGLLKEGEPVVAAVSGGPDSVALLLVLNQLRHALALDLVAAHLNHQLRGRDSDGDQEFVDRLCREQGVALFVKRCATRSQAKQAGRNLEDFARLQRYEFLFEVARRQGARVATGHNLNDQAETFLMKLVRGAGPGGLSGIYPLRVNCGDPPVTVIRPLLRCKREDILGYLGRQGQEFRRDQSNEDLSLDRNWVRGQLVPMLARQLNPGLLLTLGRTAGLFREIEDFLSEEGRKAWGRCGSQDGRDVLLEIPRLETQPPILQKEVVREAIRQCKGSLRDVSLQHVEEAIALARGGSGKQLHLPGQVRAQKEFQQLRFSTAPSPALFSYPLPVPGEVRVPEVGKQVLTRRVSAEQVPGGGVLFAFEGERLTVRNRRPGDRYRTSLKSPERKLKKLLWERRIPRSRRDRLLVLEGDGQLVWVEGFAPAASFQVDGVRKDRTVVEVKVVDCDLQR